jgi:hypothetical protein
MMTLKTKSVFGLVAGLAIALSLVIGAGTASALTAADIDTLVALGIISADKAATAKAALTTTSYSTLKIGSTGAGVVALQEMLVKGGFLVMPAGTKYGYYGSLTAAAYAKYQAAQVTTPVVTTKPTTSGTEGNLKSFDTIGKISNETADEGESDVKVLGIEMEAEDSDMTLQRVDVLFDAPSAPASNDLDDYITEVGLMYDGKVVASMDVDELDDNTDEADYKARFTGLDIVAKDGDVSELYVVVSAVKSVDNDDDAAAWTVTIPSDGIRAVDTAGLSDNYVTSDLSEDFTVETPTASSLTITVDEDDNDDETVEVKEDSSIDDVVAYTATLEVDDADLTVTDVEVTFATSSGAVLANMLEDATLFIDGDEVKTESIRVSDNGVVTFDDIDVDLNENDEVSMVVKVTVAEQGEVGDENYASSSSFYVSAVEVSYEDSEGDDQTETDSTDGGTMTLRPDAVTVDFVSAATAISPVGGDESKGRFYVTVKVTAPSDENVYIAKGATTSTAVASGKGASFKVVDGNGDNVTATTSASTNLLTKVSGGSESGDYWKITKGNSATFKLDVVVDNAGASAGRTLGVQLLGLNYKLGSAVVADTRLTDGIDEDFRSDTAYIANAND